MISHKSSTTTFFIRTFPSKARYLPILVDLRTTSRLKNAAKANAKVKVQLGKEKVKKFWKQILQRAPQQKHAVVFFRLKTAAYTETRNQIMKTRDQNMALNVD